jgi:FOG: PKD repeat
MSGKAPLEVTFHDLTIGDPTSWLWQFGDGGSSTEKDPTHQYTIPGTYTVSLRAYNDQTSGYRVMNDYIMVTK